MENIKHEFIALKCPKSAGQTVKIFIKVFLLKEKRTLIGITYGIMTYDVKFFGGFFSTLCEEEEHKLPPTLLPQYKKEVLITVCLKLHINIKK